jgi:SAM-dependent methyltransferase
MRDRLVEDHKIGNRRVTAALEFAKDALRPASSVLDVGCGIGWSSSVMAAEGKRVVGVDISPLLIWTARSMFSNCRFETRDFTQYEPAGQFDAVLMIDVYEHFAADDRPLIHDRIRRTGASLVALTTPTPAARQWALDQGISLQPIDEEVTDLDIQRLADDLAGQVAVSREVSIWRPRDYRHVLIRRTAA